MPPRTDPAPRASSMPCTDGAGRPARQGKTGSTRMHGSMAPQTTHDRRRSMNQNPHSPHSRRASPSSQPASSCWPATSVRPATFCRPALRPLAALLLGTALLGNAQAGAPIKWQKPGWDFLPRISLEYDRLKNRDLRGSGERTKSDTVPEFRSMSRYQHDSRWASSVTSNCTKASSARPAHPPTVRPGWRSRSSSQKPSCRNTAPARAWATGASMTNAPGSSTPSSTASTPPSITALTSWTPSWPATATGAVTCSTATPNTKKVPMSSVLWVPGG